MQKTIIAGETRELTMLPGDSLILVSPTFLSEGSRAVLERQLAELIRGDRRSMVLDEGASLILLHRERVSYAELGRAAALEDEVPSLQPWKPKSEEADPRGELTIDVRLARIVELVDHYRSSTAHVQGDKLEAERTLLTIHRLAAGTDPPRFLGRYACVRCTSAIPHRLGGPITHEAGERCPLDISGEEAELIDSREPADRSRVRRLERAGQLEEDVSSAPVTDEAAAAHLEVISEEEARRLEEEIRRG